MRWLLWDFEGTLALRDGQWAGAVGDAIVAQRPDLSVDLDCLRSALTRGFPWHASEQRHDHLSDGDAWWGALEPLFVQVIGAAGLDELHARAAAKRVREHYVDPRCWRATDRAADTLAKLRTRGWRHAIVSNHVPEMESIARGVGLHVERVFCSAVLGVEKPNPLMLDLVLGQLGRDRCAWMIGDNPHKDVAAASAAGIPSILLTAHDPRAVHCVATLREVVDLVGYP